MKTAITSLIILLIYFSSVSQEKIPRFGKINKDILAQTQLEKFPDALAYFIFDDGVSLFEISELLYTRHFRIKILNKNAFDIANIEIPLYEEYSSKEKAFNIRAVTYNLEDGKIIKSKIDKDNIYTEQTNKYWKSVKFAMPNVKEGSIIEVSYSVSTDFISHYLDWQFQYEIPVLLSQYYISIPEYFDFKSYMTGYIYVEKNTSSKYHTQGYLEDTYYFTAKNIPPLISEKHLTTTKNYISKVNFELLSVKIPGKIVQTFSTTWQSVTKRFSEHERFGGAIRMASFLNEDAEALRLIHFSDNERMHGAFDLIKKKFSWDGYNSGYITRSLREAYVTGSGNVADINLSLVSLLNKMGVEAYPVLLSTRKHGAINDNFPSRDVFNYVIAVAYVDGEMILLDATEPDASPNFLPERCLNGKGLIVIPNNAKWVDLTENAICKSQIMYNLKMNETGNFTGELSHTFYGYSAFDYRKVLSGFTNDKEYIKNMEEKNFGLNITDYQIQNVTDASKPIIENLSISINNYHESANDMIMFSSLFYDNLSESPFKLKNRSYPVEFSYPELTSTTVSVEIPEGYVIEYLPEPAIISFPDKSIKYLYSASQIGNTIQIVSNFEIKRTVFSPIEYGGLKELYNLMVSKNNEKIILRKSQ